MAAYPSSLVKPVAMLTGGENYGEEASRHSLPPRTLVPLLALFGSLLLVILLVPSAAAAASFEKSRPHRCSDKQDETLRLDLEVNGETTFGYFALPNGNPKGLVVFGHGRTHSAIDWRDNLKEVARRDDVVAVAMDYRHQATDLDQTSPDYGRSTGWRAIEGAEDSIAAARSMLRRCAGLRNRTVVAYGVSMGAQSSGLAVSSRATRQGGKRPLFDYWFDIEGITDIVQFYLVTRLVGLPQAAEIEEDFGGTYEQRTEFYEQHSIVNLAPDIKASGIKGVVLVDATDDPLLGYSQNKKMFERLRGVGVRSQFFTVNPSGAPLGHGNETDRTHPVINIGFDRLAALFKDGIRPRCFQEFAVDGASGAITPDPASAPC